MSFLSRAETQLLDAVNKSRRGGGNTVVKAVGVDSSGRELNVLVEFEAETKSLPAPPFAAATAPAPIKLSGRQEEVALVQTLEDKGSKLDPTPRSFPGLSRQKIEKKARHTSAIDGWGRLLDGFAEQIEQDVLRISREVKEEIASIDDGLAAIYAQFKDSSFLIPRSENDLFQLLDRLRLIVVGRARVIDGFASNLDGLETKRAQVVGTELKLLVDRLIGIAHQLPDEIEHIVESETFDLNSVLTTNRKAHAQLLGLFRKTHVEVDVEMLQRWEDGRVYWRQLRHSKALTDFQADISSERFTDPHDRKELLASFRDQQDGWRSRRQDLVQQLSVLTSESIHSSVVVDIQKRFAQVTEDELAAISDCYKQLGDLRSYLKMSAETRVEELRKELHTYGALKDEPPMRQVANVMQAALQETSLAELWRLGGGLKTDFSSLSEDMVHVDVCYERLVATIQERLELICCGFNLKAILEERGTLMQLDKVRNLITKLRGVPRGEVPGIINSIVPELEDILQVEQVNPLFKRIVAECVSEMQADMERVRLNNPAGGDYSLGAVGASLAPGNATAGGGKKTSTAAGASRQTGKSTAGKRNDKNSSAAAAAYIDPSLVKTWSRKLGILYYGSDLPPESQQACISGIEMILLQRECNHLVDQVVSDSSDKTLQRMDAQYRKLIDSIAIFLEAQSSYVALCMVNLGDYFLLIAKLVEEHRKEQRTLDEKSADELFDLSEDFRIEREDREVIFEEACQVIRASTGHDELLVNFERVLEILDKIQSSYRDYHGKACFSADKYPLLLVDEFRRYIFKVGSSFSMIPKDDHPILTQYKNIYDETIRFNKKFFDADPAAGGIEPMPPADIVQATTPADGEAVAAAAAAGDDAESSPAPAIEQQPAFTEIYTSPLVNQSELALAGSFGMLIPLEVFALRLTEEKEAPEEPAAVVAVAAASETTNGGEEGGPQLATLSSYKPPTHPDCPWIRVGYALACSEEEEAKMDDFDRIEYEDALAKSFLTLDESALASLSEEVLAVYRRCEATSSRAKERIALETEPAYIRQHVPMDSEGRPWILSIDVPVSDLTRVLGGIRESLVTSAEKESARRIARAQSLSVDNKAEFTEELEDRLRTHWPRRGRVETGIKQPRETELLSHEEKTWRHIQNIQQRVIDLQKKFMFSSEESKKNCDDYVKDMSALRNSLSNTRFRNLAALQGVDMKARALTLSFQARTVADVNTLRKMASDDLGGIIAFAMDFRKVCPPQAPGVEGGYSEAEILEIEALVIGQCQEAKAIAEEWTVTADQLVEQQEQSLKSHGEFSKRYEKCAQDLAMSEGLGQKYGAPRRRAQERVRTEVSRDEQSAGKIDELLAKLQFICDEAKRIDGEAGGNESGGEEKASDAAENGRKFLDETNAVWSILAKLRTSLQARAEYLKVVEIPIPTQDLPWMVPDRIPAPAKIDDDLAADLSLELQELPKKQTCLEDVFTEVDAACRKETKELYESEGMASILGDSGVPDSLQVWLTECREKLLGPKGHREKAWKRLYGQTTRLEQVLGRKPAGEEPEEGEDDEEENSGKATMTAPAVCMRLIANAFATYADFDRHNQEKQFMKLVRIWEKGREKHERLLRPRLGSPDAADELAQLDALEQSRSREFTESVVKFQGQLARTLVEHTKTFCEELGVSCKGLVQYIDSSMRLEALKLPPDTAVPKKRLTLKRLRKAQRIKQTVSQGGEDSSQQRMWPSIQFDDTFQAILSAETLVPDLTVPEPVAAAAAAEPAKKGAPPKKGEPVPVVETEAPTLVSKHWKGTLASTSAVKGSVTTAHRILIRQRDEVVASYTRKLALAIEEIRQKYSFLLSQEKSWIERWERQVMGLQKGGV